MERLAADVGYGTKPLNGLVPYGSDGAFNKTQISFIFKYWFLTSNEDKYVLNNPFY